MAASQAFLIYGATGYTGRLLARAAKERGLHPCLGGRNEARLAAVATGLGLEYRVAGLDRGLDEALRGVRVVLNAAGPFCATHPSLVEACLRAGAHYLDLSGEAEVFERVRERDVEARASGVMLMPGVGFDVVPSDCLVSHLARKVRDARRLVIGISGLEVMSRGSYRTLVQGVGQSILVRRGGVLEGIPPGSLLRELDFGAGPRLSVALNWADVSSAWYSTGIPDIEVYSEATPALRMMFLANRWVSGVLTPEAARQWGELSARALPDGPSEEQRAGRRGLVVAEVEDGAGRRSRARLRTPEAYGFTCTTALAIVERVLQGDLEVGFQTPARVYGPDFVLSFDNVLREEL